MTVQSKNLISFSFINADGKLGEVSESTKIVVELTEKQQCRILQKAELDGNLFINNKTGK